MTSNLQCTSGPCKPQVQSAAGIRSKDRKGRTKIEETISTSTPMYYYRSPIGLKVPASYFRTVILGLGIEGCYVGKQVQILCYGASLIDSSIMRIVYWMLEDTVLGALSFSVCPYRAGSAILNIGMSSARALILAQGSPYSVGPSSRSAILQCSVCSCS